MDPVIIVGAVVANVVFLGVAAGIWWWGKQGQAQQQAEAEQRGWTWGPGGGRVRFELTGPADDQVRWTFQARSGGRNATSEDRWSVPLDPPPPGTVMVGPKLPGLVSIDLGNPLVQMFLKRILGEDASHLEHVTPLTLDDPELETHYSVLTDNPDLARAFLSGPGRMALLDKPDPDVLVLLWPSGLQVRKRGGRRSVEGAEPLVELGLLLRAAVPGDAGAQGTDTDVAAPL